jgi:DNA mismatch repair protein MutL
MDAAAFPLGIAKAQLGKTYIVAETTDGIVLVDQHAAHERIRYEELKQRYLHQGVSKQLLLVPMVISVAADQMETLRASHQELQALGFDIDLFGTDVVVRAMPALLSHENPETLMADVINDICALDTPINLTERLLEFLATHACHTSIRAGDVLSVSEMNAMLRLIESTPNSAQCNHGRPTYVRLSFTDVEHLFSRR